jgi:hypothetical protein
MCTQTCSVSGVIPDAVGKVSAEHCTYVIDRFNSSESLENVANPADFIGSRFVEGTQGRGRGVHREASNYGTGYETATARIRG